MEHNPEQQDELINQIAIAAKKRFVKDYLERNGDKPDIKVTKDLDWIKLHGTDQVDMVKFGFLDMPKDWQGEMKAGSKIALDILLEAIKTNTPLDKNFIESAGETLHIK